MGSQLSRSKFKNPKGTSRPLNLGMCVCNAFLDLLRKQNVDRRMSGWTDEHLRRHPYPLFREGDTKFVEGPSYPPGGRGMPVSHHPPLT